MCATVEFSCEFDELGADQEQDQRRPSGDTTEKFRRAFLSSRQALAVGKKMGVNLLEFDGGYLSAGGLEGFMILALVLKTGEIWNYLWGRL